MGETFVPSEVKLSIIVPIYKSEPYLRKCLDSIVNQSYKNLEIILVDDGSPDRCGEICEEYATADPRILTVHKSNGGISSAKNTGLAIATGEWITWVDSDDWIEADMYEYMLNLALKYQVDMVQCGFWIEHDRKFEEKFTSNEILILCEKTSELTVRQLKLFSNSNWNKIYRADIIRSIFFDTSYPIGEDLLFHLYTLIKTKRIYIAAQAKYHYMQRTTSICNAPPNPERLGSYRNMLKTAIVEFSLYQSICEFLYNENLRNNMDICSKIVRYNLKWAVTLQREIQCEIRTNFGCILKSQSFTKKEKLKFAMIAFLWPIYQVCLPIWKKLFPISRQKGPV
ncbi:MAG: glycosyltransferase family 2 protein [Anaerotruncus sp.]|nr:glycosyltransferase family 2 protein [Anaerotruncus sp.]